MNLVLSWKQGLFHVAFSLKRLLLCVSSWFVYCLSELNHYWVARQCTGVFGANHKFDRLWFICFITVVPIGKISRYLVLVWQLDIWLDLHIICSLKERLLSYFDVLHVCQLRINEYSWFTLLILNVGERLLNGLCVYIYKEIEYFN